MSLDNSYEIERLKRKLEEVTAERDYLLAENRRLVQATKDHAVSSQIPGLKPVSYPTPLTNITKTQSSSPLLYINSSEARKNSAVPLSISWTRRCISFNVAK